MLKSKSKLKLVLFFITAAIISGRDIILNKNNTVSLTKSIDDKIAEAQTLRDQGMAAHDAGNHAKSEELLNKALELFKS